MVKTRQQLDIELDALAAAAPYLKQRASSAEEFGERVARFVEEIKQDASEEDIGYVEARAEQIVGSPAVRYQTPHT